MENFNDPDDFKDPDDFVDPDDEGFMEKWRKNLLKNSPVVGAVEAGVSMATSLPAMAAGGIAGIGGLANPKQKLEDNPARPITDELTYQPRSEYGKKIVEGLGKGFEVASDIATGRHMPKPETRTVGQTPVPKQDNSFDEMMAKIAFEFGTTVSPGMIMPTPKKPTVIAKDPVAARIEALAKQKKEQAASPDYPGTTPEMVANRVPTIPEAKGEIPLPELNIIDENTVPKLPIEEPAPQTPMANMKQKYTGQEDLSIFPPDVDASQVRNPYDTAGQVSRFKENMETGLDGQQGLFDKPMETALSKDIAMVEEMLARQNDVIAKQAEQAKIMSEARKFPTLVEAMEYIKGAGEVARQHTEQLKFDLDRMADLEQQRESMGDAHRSVAGSGQRTIHKFVADDGKIDHIAALVDLWKHSADQTIKTMAKYFLDNPRLLEGYEAHAYMDRNGDILPHISDKDGKRHAGEYFDSVHKGYFANNGLTGHVFMHELVHAATVRAYKTNPTLKKQVDQIYRDLKNRLTMSLEPHPRQPTVDVMHVLNVKTGERAYHYGLESPLEMLAEVFSNRDFRRFLADTSSYRTIWAKIKDAIKSLLGLKSAKELNNFLDRIDEAGKNLFDHHKSWNLGSEQIYKQFKQHLDPAWPSLKATDFDSPLAEPAKQLEIMKNIPGLRDIAENMISDYTPVEKVLPQVAKEPDAPAGSALVGGGIQLAELKKSSAIYAAHDWLSTATKKAAFSDRENISPAEFIVNDLYNGNRVGFRQLFSILTNESAEKVRFSIDELKELGVSDAVIDAHERFRDMMDDVYEKMKAKGEDVDYRQGFFSSRWQGPWGMAVTKGDRTVWYISATTKSGAEKAAAYLRNTDKELQIGKPEYRESPLADKTNNVEAGYKALLQILGDDPAAQAVKSAWEEYQVTEGRKALDQTKHFDPNTGVRGYAGDRPWMNKDKDMLEAMKEQFQYARNGYRWSELQTAISNIKELTSNLEDKPNTMKMVRDYTKNHLGVGTDPIMRAIESRVGKLWSKYLPMSGNELVELSRSLFYIKTLGVFNVPFSAASLVQPIFTNPEHFNLTYKGFKHNPIKTIGDSFADGGAILAYNLSELAPNADITARLDKSFKQALKDPFTREMAEYARQNGIVTINQFSDIKSLGSPKRQMLERVGGMNLIATEAASRSLAFAGFVSHLKQSGKFEKNIDIFKRAEELTNLTMVDYRHHERANFFNKMGLPGRMLSTLQTFHINQWNNLWRYGKEAKNGNVAPLLALLGTQYVFAGMTGMFAMEALDDMWESMKPFMPTKVQDFGVKKELIRTLPVWATYGPVSAVTGVNWSSRFDAGTIVEPTLEGLLPFASDAYKTAKSAFKAIRDPNEASGKELLHQMAPSSIKGAIDVTMFDRAEKKDGNTLYAPTSDFALGKGFERTPADVNARMIGMRTTRESAERELLYRSRINDAEMQQRRERYSERFKVAAVLGNKNDMTEAAKDYIEAEGNIKELTEWLNKSMVKGRYLTESQQILTKAGSSLSAAKKAQRLKEGLDNIKKY